MAMEISHEKIPLWKLILHVSQFVLSLTIWILEIIVFKGGDTISLNGWTFGVSFLSVPAWLYLVMAPRWPRTRKLANATVMLVVDGAFTIIWLSAFATQAAFNSGGHCGTACGASKAIVGLGIFETLFWAATTYLSLLTLQYWRANHVLPGYSSMRGSSRAQNIDPDKAAFSTAPIGGGDEEAYAPLGRHDHDGDDEQEFNAAPYGDRAGYGGGAFGGGSANSRTYGGQYNDTSYGGASGGSAAGSKSGRITPSHQNPFEDHGEYAAHNTAAPPGSHIYAPPAAHDEGDDGRPAQFPAGNYGRIQ